MIRLGHHPQRRALLAQIESSDPATDYERIYRITALQEFPWDTVTALNLAFYRTFAAPQTAALLVQTGEMLNRPTKRATDTGLFMYDLIASGLHTDRGQEIIDRLNRMHRRWPIEPEDYRYVLAAFIVVPTRWINTMGWRRLSPTEVDAAVRFYGELGRLMGVRGLPGTYAEMEAVFDDYERRFLHYSSDSARLLAATRGVLESRLPSRLQVLAGPLLRALLDDKLCECFGVRPAGPLLRTSLRLTLAGRSAVLRRRPPRPAPWFTAGRALSLYPEGYQLSDLGPDDSSPPALTLPATPHPQSCGPHVSHGVRRR